MFMKLLKHEWRANRGLVGLLCAIVGISGLMVGGGMRYTIWFALTGNQVAVGLYTLVLSASLIAGVVCCVIPMYLLAYRFYQSRFTDRGYLMLTLPVTTHQQLLSSITCTVIGIVLVSITAVTAFAAGITFFLSMFGGELAADLVEKVKTALADAEEIKVLTNYHVGQLLPRMIAFIADIILFMLALTVGGQARKRPVVKGAAVYILTDMVVSEICKMIDELTGHVTLEIMLIGLVYSMLAVGAYFIMHHIIDKKLNLT